MWVVFMTILNMASIMNRCDIPVIRYNMGLNWWWAVAWLDIGLRLDYLWIRLAMNDSLRVTVDWLGVAVNRLRIAMDRLYVAVIYISVWDLTVVFWVMAH